MNKGLVVFSCFLLSSAQFLSARDRVDFDASSPDAVRMIPAVAPSVPTPKEFKKSRKQKVPVVVGTPEVWVKGKSAQEVERTLLSGPVIFDGLITLITWIDKFSKEGYQVKVKACDLSNNYNPTATFSLKKLPQDQTLELGTEILAGAECDDRPEELVREGYDVYILCYADTQNGTMMDWYSGRSIIQYRKSSQPRIFQPFEVPSEKI